MPVRIDSFHSLCKNIPLKKQDVCWNINQGKARSFLIETILNDRITACDDIWNALVGRTLKPQKNTQFARAPQYGTLTTCVFEIFEDENFLDSASKRIKDHFYQENIADITSDSAIFNEYCAPNRLGFDQKTNALIEELVEKLKIICPYKALVVMLIAYLFPVTYNEKRIDPQKDATHFLKDLLSEYKKNLATKSNPAREDFIEADYILSVTHLLISTAEDRLSQAKKSAGRFIPHALWDYDKIDLPTLRSTVRNKSNETQLIDLVQSSDEHNIVVVGGGGSGKTFSLLSLADSLLNLNNKDIIPVYVSLHDPLLMKGSIKKYIIAMMAENSNFSEVECEQRLNSWLQGEHERNLLLLLDGYNEIATTDLQASIASEISSLIANKHIRAIVTSRYDLSYSLSQSSGTAVTGFSPYFVNELEENTVLNYIQKFFSESTPERIDQITNNAKSTDGKVKHILRTPMGLVMYCIMNRTNADIRLSVPFPDCTTQAELIANFLHCIRICHNNINEENCRFLEYIGRRMNSDGLFKLFGDQIIGYANDFFGENYESKVSVFIKDPFINDVARIDDNNNFEFMHQNYRDYFAACYLKRAIDKDFDGDKINECFNEGFVPEEVLLLLGELLGEHKCIEGTDSRIQRIIKHKKLTPDNIAQLIRIVALARKNNLSGFVFDGLDLTSTRLNKIKLYKDIINKASFAGAKVSQSTFAPLGHEGAVYTMLYIKDRYLLSFSKNDIFCFDMKSRRHYKLASYEPIAIYSSYHDEATSSIITGDAKGNCVLWVYTIDDNENISLEENFRCNFFYNAAEQDTDHTVFGLHCDDSALPFCSNVLDFVKFNDNIYVGLQCGYIGNLTISGRELVTRYIASCAFDDGSDCRLSAGKTALYACCGNKIKKLIFDENDSYKCDELCFENGVIIKDIAIFNCGNEEYLLANASFAQSIWKTEYTGTCSDVFAIPVSAFNNSNNFNATNYSIYRKQHSVTGKGFKGWISFSEQHENSIYLTADIEDAVGDAGLLRISVQKKYINEYEEEYNLNASELYGNRHSMSVTCCKFFEYNQKNYIVTGSAERSIELLSSGGGDATLLYHLAGHDNGIHSIDIINDQEIITAHYSGEVCVWRNLKQGWKCVHYNELHEGWVWQVKHITYNKKDYIISCSYDGSIAVIEKDTEELICRIHVAGRVLTFGMLSDNLLLTGYIDGNENVLQKFCIDYDNKTYNAGKPIKEYNQRPIDNLRYITHTKDGLMLCFNDGRYGIVKTLKREKNAQLDSIVFSAEKTIKTSNERINLRCADELQYGNRTIRAVVGDIHKDYISNYICIAACNQNEKVTAYTTISNHIDGCSAVKLTIYNGSLYLITGSYDWKIYIHNITITDEGVSIATIAERRFSSKVLDIQCKNNMIYISTLNGDVAMCSLLDILKDTTLIDNYFQKNRYTDGNEKNYYDYEILFKGVSGFNFCHLDMTEVDAECWNDNFRQKLSYYAKVNKNDY